jgi:hypothetical protein
MEAPSVPDGRSVVKVGESPAETPPIEQLKVETPATRNFIETPGTSLLEAGFVSIDDASRYTEVHA